MIQRTYCVSIVLLILGITCIIAGVLLFVYADSLIKSNVNKGCELREGTNVYAAWRHSPVPTKISFYLFNLTNEDFLDGTNRPRLQDVGPFVYEERRTKFNLEEFIDGTIAYHENRTYKFLESESLDENTKIKTMNVAYMTIVNLLQTMHVDDSVRTILMGYLSKQEMPIIERTVKELLWGYEDPFLKLLKDNFPSLVPDDTISLYNASVSGTGANTYLINSGVNVLRNQTDQIQFVGNIERYNGNEALPYWSSKYANMINGTDSTIWHPNVQSDDIVHIFNPDICRSLTLTKTSEYVNPFRITNYRFQLIPDIFSNTVRQDFCLNTTAPNKTTYIRCLADGAFSLSTCIKPPGTNAPIRLPIIASSPHFFDGAQLASDVEFETKIGSTEPYKSFMDIEPITGTVMNGSRRIQINLDVLHDDAISPISKVKPVIFPMLWIDEHTEIDEKNANDFRSLVYTSITTLSVIKYLLVCLGSVVFVIACGLTIRKKYKESNEGAVFPTSDENTPLFS